MSEPPGEGTPRGADALRRDLEAILFVADEPLSSASLAGLIEAPRGEVESALEWLAADAHERGAGIVVRQVAGGWRLYTARDAAPAVERFVRASRHARLTRASLETLSIVAYKQPVTRHQISAIRGVDSEGVLRSLAERGLIVEVGRDDGPGRPVLYGTTSEFLERIGLSSVADLPPLAPLLGEEGEPEEGSAGAEAERAG